PAPMPMIKIFLICKRPPPSTPDNRSSKAILTKPEFSGIWLDCCPPSPSDDATGQNFVDAAIVEIDDLETPALAVKAFAGLRQRAELTEHESGGRMIAAARRQRDGQPVGHFVRRHAARYQPRSIIALHRFRFDRACIRSESASDRFQDVRVGDKPLKLAVLVVNERHMDP